MKDFPFAAAIDLIIPARMRAGIRAKSSSFSDQLRRKFVGAAKSAFLYQLAARTYVRMYVCLYTLTFSARFSSLTGRGKYTIWKIGCTRKSIVPGRNKLGAHVLGAD